MTDKSPIRREDLQIDTHSSGIPGVNARSTVYITHKPTGIVSTASGNSQLLARKAALKALRAALPDQQSPPKHTVYVQIRRPTGFFASCLTCGTELFSDRASLAEAEADAHAHGELRHVYSRDDLELHDYED